MLDQPVQRLYAHVVGQEHTVLAVIVAAVRKTVLAAQVAIVRRVQAHRLYSARSLYLQPRVVVVGQKLPRLLHLVDLGNDLAQIVFVKEIL